MAKDTPYVDVQNLSKSFGALQLFDNISFSIAEGQRVGLVAKNGTGKSTLLAVLAGKEGCDSGDIVFRRDLRVGFLEQSPRFDPDESVLDACFNHQGDPDKVLKAKQVLTQLKIRDLNQPMRQLSGGQQKRVALANVLLTEPDLLILDDLGTEFTNAFTVTCLYQIVNTRLTHGLSTVISTNLTPDELTGKYDERLTSRLLGAYRVLQFKGRDIRFQKLAEEL